MTVQSILRREETAGRKGCDWLATIPPDQLSADQHIQRLFALGAFSAAHPRAFRLANIDLRRLAGALPEFVWHRCPGDPFFAVAASRLLARHPVGLETFDELRKGLRAVLFGEEQDGTATPLWADLLLEKGKSYLPPKPAENLPELGTLLDGDREIIIEACRVLMHASSCGTVPLAAAPLNSGLPMLCVSYARSFDIQMVCRLLRSCAYLGIAEAIQCTWAREWLLHQQQQDGRFGLLEMEASRAGKSLNASDLYFVCTVEAIWTIAELTSRGVIVRRARQSV
jgi:hypothetical protein